MNPDQMEWAAMKVVRRPCCWGDEQQKGGDGLPNKIAPAATNMEIGGKIRRKEAGGKRKMGKKKGGLWIFLDGPSWRGSSLGMIIMVFPVYFRSSYSLYLILGGSYSVGWIVLFWCLLVHETGWYRTWLVLVYYGVRWRRENWHRPCWLTVCSSMASQGMSFFVTLGASCQPNGIEPEPFY